MTSQAVWWAMVSVGWTMLALAASSPDEIRLDTWDKTYIANTEAPGWAARKYAPLIGSGDRYFFQFIHDSPSEHYLHLASGSDNGFAVGAEKAYPLKEWQILEWDWKMAVMPKGGDVRFKEKDDQAGSMCVVIDPGLNFDSSLCYLFENVTPKEGPYTNARKNNSRFLVIRTVAAGDPVGQWLHERRNVYEDYKRVFGHEPRMDGNFGVQIDSNDTESSAEAFYRNIVLHKP